MRDHLIALYWVIMCCDWENGEALDCPDPEAASGGKDVFIEEVLADKLFQVPLKVLVVDGFVPLAVVEGTVLFCSREYEIVLDQSFEDLVDGKLEWGEVLCRLEGLE